MSTPEDQTPDIDAVLDNALGVDTSASRQPADEPQPESAGESDGNGTDIPSITAGGRTFASHDELVKAYEEAQKLISQTRPQEPEPEPEYVDPLTYLPVAQDQNVANQVIASAQNDAKATAEWIWENQDDPRFTPELVDMVVNHWASQNPAAWSRFQYVHHQQMAEQVAEERTSGIRQQQIDVVSREAEEVLKTELGEDYKTYEARIEARIKAGDFVRPKDGFPNGIPTTQALTSIVRKMYREEWLNDHWDEVYGQLAKPDPNAATTQTKGQKAAPKDEIEGVLDRMLA